MSEEAKGASGAPEIVSDGTPEIEQVAQPASGVVNADAVLEKNKQLLGEKRKVSTQLEEALERVNALEQEKLEAKGQLQDALNMSREENAKLKAKINNYVENSVYDKAEKYVMSEVAKLGCVDPDGIVKIYKDELVGLEFDDRLNPSEEILKTIVSKAQKERSHMFSKPAPKIGSHQIKTDDVKGQKPKNISSMKQDELMELWAKAEK